MVISDALGYLALREQPKATPPIVLHKETTYADQIAMNMAHDRRMEADNG
jgi:hypothetical protein